MMYGLRVIWWCTVKVKALAWVLYPDPLPKWYFTVTKLGTKAYHCTLNDGGSKDRVWKFLDKDTHILNIEQDKEATFRQMRRTQLFLLQTSVTHTHTHTRMHTHTHAFTHTCTCKCMHTHTHIYLPSYPLHKFSKVVWTGNEFKESSVRNIVTIAPWKWNHSWTILVNTKWEKTNEKQPQN